MEENGTSGPYSAGGDTERYDAQEDRGRSRSRDPPGRPQAGGVQGVKKEGDRPRESFESRRSVFTEEI